MQPDQVPLILFAKAPIAGRVKTRLQSNCSAVHCARIAEQLLFDTVSLAVANWPGRIVLSSAIDHEHPFLQSLAQKFTLETHVQVTGDLGQKMHTALEDLGYPALVMGCDVPHLPPQILMQAHRLLTQRQSVIGPALDGGYYMLGLQSSCPELFKDIAWGSDQVLTSTLAKATEQNLNLTQLAAIQDIDYWEDLLKAAQQLPSL